MNFQAVEMPMNCIDFKIGYNNIITYYQIQNWIWLKI